MDLSDPMVIRKMFKEGDDVRDSGLTTPEDIVRYDNIQYGDDSTWNLLDVYHQKGVTTKQPTIVSVHGGGWVYGDKERYQYYCMNLAQRGFTVVNYTYRLAPEHKFPNALEDLNSVFRWISKNAEKYNIDKEKVFTVGDSAGGQLSSQYLALFTNEDYQKLFDFEVPCEDVKVLGCALNCGIYDIKADILNGAGGIFLVYIDQEDENQMKQVDTIRYVSEKFPPSFVMTSYHDFLKHQGEPMYNLLQSKGVVSEFHLYGTEEQKHMGHVFHLDMKSEDAKICNDAECDFFKKILNN